MKIAHLRQMGSEDFACLPRKDSHPVLLTLAVADEDFASIEFHVLGAEAQRFEETKA